MKNKWKILYEEEFPDDWGYNACGILTNGKDVLFFHILPEPDGQEICHIFSSLACLVQCEQEEACFPWTTENEQKMYSALESLEDNSRLCGENSILYETFNTTKS